MYIILCFPDDIDPNEPIKAQPRAVDARLSWKLADPPREQFSITIRQQTMN